MLQQYKKGKRRQLERGQGLVEYALILVLVAVATIVSLIVFAEALNTMLRCAHYGVTGATSAPVTMIVDGNEQQIACGGAVPAGSITLYTETFPGDPTSVAMTISGTGLDNTQNEYHAPYALFGDSGSSFGDRALSPGNYVVEMVGTNAGETTTIWFVFNVT